MQNQVLASQVHEIFSRGLDLHERLERGDHPDFFTEHDHLRKLLWGEGEAASNAEYAGAIAIGSTPGAAGFDPGNLFLGARYALACWLDELFVLNTPWAPEWSDQWKENMLEVEVVGTGSGEAAWRFWRQAIKHAPTRPGTDALEVYLWCVMLGFRGTPESEGVDPVRWAESTRKHIIQSRNQRFPHDAGGDPRPNVDILNGRKQVLLMLRLGVLVLAGAAFILGRALVLQ